MEKKLKYPELEQDNYVAQTEAEIAEAKKRAEQLEKQAKWDRDMALWGDMANIAAKGAAMHGGAWKINKDESAAAKGNERLRALQKENAARLAELAKAKVAAQDKSRKERNAAKLAEYNAEVEQYKRDLEAQKYAKEQERKDRQEARQTAESIAKINYYNKGGRRTTGGGSSVNRDVFIVKDDGTKEYFKHADDANNVQAAYARLPKEYRVEKAVPRTETIRGRKVYVKDSEGKQVYDYMEDLDASLEQKRQAISDYNNRELIEDWTPEEDEIIDYEPNK